MCENCWIEAGRPAIRTEKTEALATAIDELYDTDGGGVGGYAHVVTDDWNTDDGCVKACLKDAEQSSYADHINEETRQASLIVLNLMVPMSEDERLSALAISRGLV